MKCPVGLHVYVVGHSLKEHPVPPLACSLSVSTFSLTKNDVSSMYLAYLHVCFHTHCTSIPYIPLCC